MPIGDADLKAGIASDYPKRGDGVRGLKLLRASIHPADQSCSPIIVANIHSDFEKSSFKGAYYC